MTYMRNAYKILIGKNKVEITLDRLRRKWEGHIKKYLREIVWGYGLDSAGS
jgi:hypothetical protein